MSRYITDHCHHPRKASPDPFLSLPSPRAGAYLGSPRPVLTDRDARGRGHWGTRAELGRLLQCWVHPTRQHHLWPSSQFGLLEGKGARTTTLTLWMGRESESHSWFCPVYCQMAESGSHSWFCPGVWITQLVPSWVLPDGHSNQHVCN